MCMDENEYFYADCSKILTETFSIRIQSNLQNILEIIKLCNARILNGQNLNAQKVIFGAQINNVLVHRELISFEVFSHYLDFCVFVVQARFR